MIHVVWGEGNATEFHLTFFQEGLFTLFIKVQAFKGGEKGANMLFIIYVGSKCNFICAFRKSIFSFLEDFAPENSLVMQGNGVETEQIFDMETENK